MHRHVLGIWFVAKKPRWKPMDPVSHRIRVWYISKGRMIPCSNPSCPPHHTFHTWIFKNTFSTISKNMFKDNLSLFQLFASRVSNCFWLKYVLTIYISWLYTHKLHNQLQLSCKFFCTPCFSLKFLVHNLHNMLTILFLLCQDFSLSIAYLFLNKHCRLYFFQWIYPNPL